VDARRAPQRIVAAHLRISFRVSGQTGGRPGWPRRTFQVQNTRNPLRCQSITVSGLTMTRADRQPIQNRDIPRNPHRDKRYQKNLIRSGQLGSLHRALQDVELMAKSGHLHLKSSSAKAISHGCQNGP
jgi:hypothetical protein